MSGKHHKQNKKKILKLIKVCATSFNRQRINAPHKWGTVHTNAEKMKWTRTQRWAGPLLRRNINGQ